VIQLDTSKTPKDWDSKCIAGGSVNIPESLLAIYQAEATALSFATRLQAFQERPKDFVEHQPRIHRDGFQACEAEREPRSLFLSSFVRLPDWAKRQNVHKFTCLDRRGVVPAMPEITHAGRRLATASCVRLRVPQPGYAWNDPVEKNCRIYSIRHVAWCCTPRSLRFGSARPGRLLPPTRYPEEESAVTDGRGDWPDWPGNADAPFERYARDRHQDALDRATWAGRLKTQPRS